MPTLLARAVRRAAREHVRYVVPVAPEAAAGLAGRVYRQMERDFGMLAPPVTLHSPAPQVLAACWLMLRETLIATGRSSRAAKEAVAAAVSAENRCPYCVEIHAATLTGLAAARSDEISEAALRFPADQAPELIGVAITFHYLNRMVNVFLLPSPLPAGLPAPTRRVLRWGAGRLLAGLVRTRCRPGESVELLPAAPPPDDLAWAAGHPTIAEAMARAWTVLDLGGERAVPEAVRELVLTTLAGWDGTPASFDDLAGYADAVDALDERDRAVGRLALFTAMASYRVTPSVVEAVQAGRRDDASLLELTGWASLAAARRAGALLVARLA